MHGMYVKKMKNSWFTRFDFWEDSE